MITVTTYRANEVPPFAAEQMARLTNSGSDHHRWLTAASNGSGESPMPDDLVYAVISRDDDWDIHVIGWASVYLWQGVLALEGFVKHEERGKRVGSTLCNCLALSGNIPMSTPVAVFSPAFAAIAKWVGFDRIQEWKRVDDGWVRVG